MPMMMLNNLVAQTRLSIQRIYQVLAMPELSLPQSDQQPQEASITFEQVSFHYPQARTGAALQEVSFHVPAGQIVALVVGPSGAGKKHRGALAAALRRPGQRPYPYWRRGSA